MVQGPQSWRPSIAFWGPAEPFCVRIPKTIRHQWRTQGEGAWARAPSGTKCGVRLKRREGPGRQWPFCNIIGPFGGAMKLFGGVWNHLNALVASRWQMRGPCFATWGAFRQHEEPFGGGRRRPFGCTGPSFSLTKSLCAPLSASTITWKRYSRGQK